VVTRLPSRRPLVCLVTHGERLQVRGATSPASVADAIVTQAREAAAAGVDIVQLRELDLEGGALSTLAERCVRAVDGTATRVLVNDRLDVAVAAGAHGVHLRGDSYPAARVRAVTPPGFIIGRSVHAVDEAAAVASEGAVDFLVFGTVFSSASKPIGHVPAGLDVLARVVDAAGPVPVLAIGGVSVASVPLISAAGAAGVASPKPPLGFASAFSSANCSVPYWSTIMWRSRRSTS
jgi:thiamine-phosphate pyrophosphorylase